MFIKSVGKLVNNQLTGYLDVYIMQSDFRSGYGYVTATSKVLNDVSIVLDSKKLCAAIFIDMAKAFDTVDHSLLVREPWPQALLNLHKQHSLGSRKLSHPFICR